MADGVPAKGGRRSSSGRVILFSNLRNHWQLFILSPIQNTIVFLCSLGNKPNRQFKNISDAAMEASRRLNSRKGRVKWIIPMSRMQVGSYECGYYVMLHMLNIVLAVILEMWDERFVNLEPFSSEEIDEVRTRWASYFLEMTQSINDMMNVFV
ncbi:unnamed protein product [Cuscuta europaea]|uniref:Ubiquitin-like protease family profile domain-containing protein n=1 Tax=Cuscuta europaea TaxID=41803 RepID=A0A9P1E0B2_CUSEU|nr:unnamed protein product [Cuscuta europaea]